MTIERFIDENRDELIDCIANVMDRNRIDDDEIELWVCNDEVLYNWALDCGVEDI